MSTVLGAAALGGGLSMPRAAAATRRGQCDGCLSQCAACGRQTSVTAGTIFQDTRLPLTTWFRAIWWVTSQKTGASALGVQHILGLGSYQTAWTWLHKLRRAMVRPGRERLTARSKSTRRCWVGSAARAGGPRPRRALIAVAAEEAGRGIGRIRMRRIPDGSVETLTAFVTETVESGARCTPTAGTGTVECARTGIASGHVLARPSRTGIGAVAPGAPGRLVAQAMAPGHPSGRGEPRPFGLLLGRVHVPIQSSPVAPSGQTLLPSRPTGRHGGSRSIPRAGQRPQAAASPLPVGAT